jgi:hypothetical protein
LVGNPKEETGDPEARKRTLKSLLQLALALVGRQAESEANDPIPEEVGISIRLASLTARPSLKWAKPLRASMVALVVPVSWFYSRTVGCDIQKVHGPAVPMSPSKAQYAGEDLTVSEYGTGH